MKQNVKKHLKSNVNTLNKKNLSKRKKKFIKNLFDLEKLGFSDSND